MRVCDLCEDGPAEVVGIHIDSEPASLLNFTFVDLCDRDLNLLRAKVERFVRKELRHG